MAIKFFDMFAGIGGFRSGLEAIGGFECVGYCEIDKYAKQAYESMYDTGGELYFEDARKIMPEQLPHIDLITGGFPCQSFSIAGERHGVAVALSCRFTADGNADCHAVFRTFRSHNFIGVNFKHWGYICGLFCPICRINSHNCRSYNYGL